MQHGVEPLGQSLALRHDVGDVGVADLVLGAHQPLREGRLRHQEGARDLGRAQPAQQAQRQRDLGVGAPGQGGSR